MMSAILLLLLANLQYDNAFKLQILTRFSASRGSLYVQTGTYDFDMVRPALEFNLGDVLEVESFLKENGPGAKIQGVYAVQDAAGTVLYVGSSMSMPVDISRLSLKLGNEIVNTLRVQTFPNPKPDAIEAYKLELIRQLSPSGNLVDFAKWEDKAVIRETVEEAVSAVDSDLGADKRTARERLADAVDSDGTKAAGDVESPFAEVDPDSYVIGPNSSAGIEFTKENVDKVLDEVRPYLIADGGNVEVVSVDEFTRSVSLSLQGACGSCPSSTTTMKMGIERVLKENFPNLGPVLQVTPAAATGLTVEEVEKALEKVIPAIKAMGGLVEVWKVDAATGSVALKYSGPARLKVGIQLVMKDLSLVKEVTISDFPPAEK